MFRAIFLIQLFALASFSTSSAQSNAWELKKDENGIKIYVRSNAESSFDEFKAITVIPNCRMAEALALIQNIENYGEWFPDCSNPKMLKKIDEYHNIHYIETDAPWPVDDRYGVYEQTATLSNNDTKAEIVFIAKADYPIEENDMVRITNAWGRWTLEEKNNDLTVTYEFKGDPGGEVPAWLANAFVVKHPYEALHNITMLMSE